MDNWGPLGHSVENLTVAPPGGKLCIDLLVHLHFWPQAASVGVNLVHPTCLLHEPKKVLRWSGASVC